MAQRRKKTNNATERIKSLYIDNNIELLNFGTNLSFKQEEEPKKLKKEKPAKTAFAEWARNWKEGDPLPFVPPGKNFLLDVISSNVDHKIKYGYGDVKPERLRSINEIGLMASKSILGPTLRSMPNALSLIARVARSRGIIVDDDGKLRCPAGTPAANQFTDLQMSNCLVPSARTLAGDAADKIKPGGAQALSGNIAPGNRIIPDPANPDVHTFDSEERARRFLTFRNKKNARFRIVSSIFGDIRSNAGAKKALLRAFPGMDKKSLDDFLNGETNLYGEDLLNYLDFRQQMIASLLYEASKNRELAENVKFVFKKVDQLGDEGAAITLNIEIGDANLGYEGVPVQPFFQFAYIPHKMARLHKNVKNDHLAIGISNDPDNPLSASDFGSETGIHEFGHMADFYKFLTDMGLDTKTMDFGDAVRKIEDKAGNTNLASALGLDLINESEYFIANSYSDLLADLSNATTDNDKNTAFELFYERIYDRFNSRGAFSLGADEDENEKIAVGISQAVGSLYAQGRNDDGTVNRNETVAEMHVALSLFPEELQKHIDELNNNHGYNIPDVDELAKMFFGSDVLTPATSGQNIRGQGRGTRLRRAVSTFVRPNSRTDTGPKLTDEDVSQYANSIEEAIQERSRRKLDTRRKIIVEEIFSRYSSDEIKNILSSIPESKRDDNRFIASLLTVPEVLQSQGVVTLRQTDWINFLSEALRNDWIDFNAITAAYALRGGDGPLRTIRAATRPVSKARKQRAERKRNSRNAARTTSSLSGNISSNRAARRTSKPPKIEGSLSQQKIQKLSGNMGYVKKNNIPINDERNSPELMPRVSGSIQQEKDGKTKITWGDDSWEYDVSDTTDDKIWTRLGLPEWATFHGNFGMRYVSSMLMGLDTPRSVGQDEDPVNAFGRRPIHRALMSGLTRDLSDDDKDRVRKMVEDTVSALRSIENPDNRRDYEIYRGLTGVPEGAQILGVKEGDKIEMPLSAFTPSETWASEMAEFTEDGEGVMIRVLPGAQTTASTSKYDSNAEGQWANAFEVVTAGEFEVVSVEDIENEPLLITMRQTAIFDTNESKYKKTETTPKGITPNEVIDFTKVKNSSENREKIDSIPEISEYSSYLDVFKTPKERKERLIAMLEGIAVMDFSKQDVTEVTESISREIEDMAKSGLFTQGKNELRSTESQDYWYVEFAIEKASEVLRRAIYRDISDDRKSDELVNAVEKWEVDLNRQSMDISKPASSGSAPSRRLSGSMSNERNYFQMLEQDSIKSYEGYDRDYIKNRLNEITKKTEEKYGKITTVRDAREALKKLFNKVEINHLGLGFDPENPRSDLNDILPDHQKLVVMALLFTLGDLPSLKNRRLILSHQLDGEGNPSPMGSNGTMMRSNPNGPDYPYFGTKINIPFDWDTLVNGYLPSEEMSYIDGHAIQTGKSILAAAKLETGIEQEKLVSEAVAMIAIGVAVHEAIHALDMPQKADKIIGEIAKNYPNASDDKTRFMYLAQEEEANNSIIKTKLIKDIVEDYVSGEAGYNIKRAMQYRDGGPSDFIQNAQESQKQLQEILLELQNQIDEASQVMSTLPSVGEALQAMFFLDQVQATYERVENEISRLQNEISDIETNINNGTPEESSVAKLAEIVYGAGLNYLFEIIPEGHPGHLTDVEMTVDKDGNMIPFIFEGQMIKNINSTKEFLESFALEILQNDDLHDPSLGLIPQAGAAALLGTNRTQLFGKDSTGNPYFDITPIIQNFDASDMEDFMSRIGLMLFHAKLDSFWPQGVKNSSKWEFVDFMQKVSTYGAKPPIDYRFGLTFASPQDISSSEIATELISSLIMGGGAARVPMTPDVRKTALAILDFVYDGDSWKNLLPQISLDALGI